MSEDILVRVNPPSSIVVQYSTEEELSEILSNCETSHKPLRGYIEIAFTQANALFLRNFLLGRRFNLTPKDRAYLKYLADEGEDALFWSGDINELSNHKKPRAHKTFLDLVNMFPFRYIDRSQPQAIKNLKLNEEATVVGKVVAKKPSYIGKSDIITITVEDAQGQRVRGAFFNQRWLDRQFKIDDPVILTGQFTEYHDKRTGKIYPQISNPKIDKLDTKRGSMKVIPVYSQRGAVGKTWETMRDIQNILEKTPYIKDPVPEELITKHGLISREQSYRKIHFPDSIEEMETAKRRIGYEELLQLQTYLNLRNSEWSHQKGSPKENFTLADEQISKLPYTPTGAQTRAIKLIQDRMTKAEPMHMMLQGDVSSGKALPLTAKVLTPDGFILMKNVTVGQPVLNPHGDQSTVIGVYPQEEKHNVYEIVFEDGSKAHGDENHLWNVFTDEEPNGKTVTTKYLAEVVATYDSSHAVQYANLGNYGVNTAEAIVHSQTFTLKYENARVVVKNLHPSNVNSSYAIRRDILDRIVYFANANKASQYVFDSYETASVLYDLFLSVNGHASIQQIKKNYVVEGSTLRTPQQNINGKVIKSVSIASNEYTQCIMVDDPSHLYVTDSFTVTHNTTVLQYTVLAAVSSGYQAAVVAPTDILAQQLFERISEDAKQLSHPPVVEFLAGKMKKKDMQEVYKRLIANEIDILVGTHAILQKSVKFHNLGAVVIDEQHKFGTKQRSHLIDVNESGVVPDLLIMSATPIPRTLASVIYGDMDLTILDELPAGRLPIETIWTPEPDEAWQHIKDEVKKGHQAYVVTSLVEESETIDAKSAQETFLMLQSKMPGVSIGLMHGKLKGDEKTAVMDDFVNNKISVLVSTTVIEVGVNVPNATVIAILNSERFGLASLHQIRGRVGRSSIQSTCYLIGEPNSVEGEERMQALVASNDGFYIAEKDLQIRGEGKLFGVNQSGESDLKLSNIYEHRDLIEKAKEDVQIAKTSPDFVKEVKKLYEAKTIDS